MAERSFKAEVEHLRKGDGDVFTGEGILAITKALLENGVGYVGGYHGAPISHLMYVLADAEELMGELGVRFVANASEAAGCYVSCICALSDPWGGDIQRTCWGERGLRCAGKSVFFRREWWRIDYLG